MSAEVESVKPKRKLVNLLLEPFQQLRLGLVSVVTCLLFVSALGAYIYTKLMQFTDVVVTLTQADDEIQLLLGNYLSAVAVTTLVGTAVFIFANLLLTIYLTHKMVGPIVAFRRHIRQLMNGRFDAKTNLRSGDAFVEVADDLNNLSDRLKELVKQHP